MCSMDSVEKELFIMTQRNKFPSNRLSNCSNICPEFANHKSANLSCCMVYYSELHCLFLLSLKFYLLYHYNIRIPRYRKFYQDPFVTCTEQKCDLSAIISKCFTVKTRELPLLILVLLYNSEPHFSIFSNVSWGLFVISSPVLFCDNSWQFLSHSQSLTYTVYTRVNQFLYL